MIVQSEITTSILQAHSQTFIGVLASLLLITIIWNNESNFVIQIIHERSKAIKEIWKGFNTSISTRSKKWRFLNPEAGKMLEYMMKIYLGNDIDLKQKIHWEEEYEDNFLLLDDKIDTLKQSFVTNYLRHIMPMIYNKINSIMASKKIIVSAIFALMSCILVFILDEFMAIFPSTCDFCASFLSLFLILGTAFWLGMWISFFTRHLPKDEKGEFQKKANEKIDKNVDCILKVFFRSSSSFPFIFILSFWGMICCTAGSFISCVWLKQLIIFGLGMIIPAGWIGWNKLRGRDFTEKNPYSFAINHFLAFCTLALIWTAILFLGSKYSPGLAEAFFLYSNWSCLLIFLELYLIFIGIICPIFIPYLNTYILQWYMSSHLLEPKRFINKDERWITINKEVEDLYRSIFPNT